MTKKHIKKLILESYTKNNLDQKKVERIAERLTRKELKHYIKALKNLELQRSVIVSSPRPLKGENIKNLKNMFGSKKIIYNLDPNLILGMRIQDNDILYEMDLKNTLDDLAKYIGETND
ncbi:MAG: hypothetical protein ABH816_02945 [Candidatus Levyibacteriota bacterium]